MAASFLGLAWWLWVLLALAVIAGVVFARRAGARDGQRDEAERMAQRADASHEGARTHHEGGP